MRPQEWLPAERHALWHSMFARALTEGPFRTEFSLLEGLTIELSLNPILQDGRTAGISLFGKDITSRKKAERTLRDAEAKYRGIFENAMEGIYRTTPQGKIISANPAMARMLGYASAEEAAAEIADTAHQVWMHPEERFEFLRRVNEGTVVRGYECQFRRKDGTRIWVSFNMRKVSGETTYYEGFVEDD